MRFIGNKENLIERIYHSLVAHDVKGESFFDFFAGTASVGRFFKKKKYRIISADLLYFSYCLQKAYIDNNHCPDFAILRDSVTINDAFLCASPLESVLSFLNTIKPMEGFIYQNYAPGGTVHLPQPRMYLSNDNAKKIDAIRTEIERWHKQEFLTESEYFILLACLIESVSLFANISGVYAAFQKKWDSRALKEFRLKPIEIIHSDKSNTVFHGDSMKLLPHIKTDILYLDPPYNTRQYAPNYHLIETIAQYDNPEIYGVTGMRPYQQQKSSFCNRAAALEDLDKIAKTGHYKYLLLSYNNEGVMPEEAILDTLRQYGALKRVIFDYARFKSNSNGENKKAVHERLYILRAF